MNNLYLGIDTSNYKTSLAVITSNDNTVYSRSELLDVKVGERGLRQSDAFFQHSNRLPVFVDSLFRELDASDIRAVGVSTRPRRIEGSYMPCFLAGYNLARELSAALKIPCYEFSHQEGHAAAVLEDETDRTGFFHLSGGTTEFLICKKRTDGYKMEIVGGTKDISLGQLLDRIGVALGMKFPSGKYLDEITKQNCTPSSIIPAINIDNGYFNLSGIETKILRYIESEPSRDDINSMISELFDVIAGVLSVSAKYIKSKYGVEHIYIAGGVASSQTIRKAVDLPYVRFGSPELSGDNAVGIAKLSCRMNKEV